jgi:serine/threonine-protein kinase
MIGQTISHYKITEKLGEGGMGEVYLAEDTSLKRKVALKFLPDYLQQDEVAQKRFLREAQSAAALDHPYICHINEVGEADGKSFIAMEYVKGQTLQDKLLEGPVPFEEAVQISKEIADALTIAHKRGVVHRDLKPANIMLTPQGHAKVMDFGLAKRVAADDGTEQDLTSGLTTDGSTLGTPAYMSPEQVRAQPVDHRTDIFSFGVILYEMLTGVHPFRRSRPVETMGAILHEEPEPLAEHLPGSSGQLQQIVEDLLVKVPDERIQSIEEVANRLSQLQAEELRLMAFMRSRLGKRLTLVLNLIVVIILLGWWVFREQPSEDPGPILSSIAVLPLENLSDDPEQDYFVDGMTDALITDLSKIGALQVIARHSAMLYKGTEKPLSEIAQELNVEAVIQGSVLREADQVQITAQLIDAATGAEFWAESYERELTSILALHSEVAQTIARQIQVALAPGEETLLTRTRQVNPEAYEAYVTGMSHVYEFTQPGLETARKYFELALEKDPNYAAAYAGIAWTWGSLKQFNFVSSSEAGPKVQEFALKAIELDDTSAEAHHALAVWKTWTDWDWEGAEASYLRALELKPNYADARAYYGNYLTLTQRQEEAMPQVKRALELDPFNMMFQDFHHQILYSTGRYDENIEYWQKMLAEKPNHPQAHRRILESQIATFIEKGMYEEAFEVDKAWAIATGRPELAEALEQGYAQGGFKGAMRRAAEVLPNFFYLVQSGQKKRFLDRFEQRIEKRFAKAPYIVNNRNTIALLRDEPRFQDLLRRMNFPEDAIARILEENP